MINPGWISPETTNPGVFYPIITKPRAEGLVVYNLVQVPDMKKPRPGGIGLVPSSYIKYPQVLYNPVSPAGGIYLTFCSGKFKSKALFLLFIAMRSLG